MVEIIEIDSHGEEVICTGVSFSSQKRDDTLKRKEPLFSPPTPEEIGPSRAGDRPGSNKRRKSTIVSDSDDDDDEDISIIDDPRNVVAQASSSNIPNPSQTSPTTSHPRTLAQIITEKANKWIRPPSPNISSTSSSLVGQASSVGPKDDTPTKEPYGQTSGAKSEMLSRPSTSTITENLETVLKQPKASTGMPSHPSRKGLEEEMKAVKSDIWQASLPLRLRNSTTIQKNWGITPRELVDPKHLVAPIGLTSLSILARMASEGVPLQEVRKFLQAALDASEGVDGNPPQLTTGQVKEARAELSKLFPREALDRREDNERDEEGAPEVGGDMHMQDVAESTELPEPLVVVKDERLAHAPSRQHTPSVTASKHGTQGHNSPQAPSSALILKSPVKRKIPRRASEVDELEESEYVQMPFQPFSQQETINEDVPASSSFMRPKANLSIFKSNKRGVFPILGVTDNVSSPVRTAGKGKGRQIMRSPAAVTQPTASPRASKPTDRPFWKTIDDSDDIETTLNSESGSMSGVQGPKLSPALAAMASLNMASIQEARGPSDNKLSKTPRFAITQPPLNQAMEQLIAQEKRRLDTVNENPTQSISHAAYKIADQPLGQVQRDLLDRLEVANVAGGSHRRTEDVDEDEPRHRVNRIARKSAAGRPRLVDPTGSAEKPNLALSSDFSTEDADSVAGHSYSVPGDVQRLQSAERQAVRVRSARKTTGSSLPRATPASQAWDEGLSRDGPKALVDTVDFVTPVILSGAALPKNAFQSTVMAEDRPHARFQGTSATRALVPAIEPSTSLSVPQISQHKASRTQTRTDSYPDWIAQAPPIFVAPTDDTQDVTRDLSGPSLREGGRKKWRCPGPRQGRSAVQAELSSGIGIGSANDHLENLPTASDQSSAPQNSLRRCTEQAGQAISELRSDAQQAPDSEPGQMNSKASGDKEPMTVEPAVEAQQPGLRQRSLTDLPTQISTEDSIDLQLDDMAVDEMDELELKEPEPPLSAQTTTVVLEGTALDGKTLQTTPTALPHAATLTAMDVSMSESTTLAAPPEITAVDETKVDSTAIAMNPAIAQSIREIGAQVLSTVSRADRSASTFNPANYLLEEGRLTRRAARVRTPPKVHIASAGRLKEWEDQLMVHNDSTLSQMDGKAAEPLSRPEDGHNLDQGNSTSAIRSLRARNVHQVNPAPSPEPQPQVDLDPDMLAFRKLSFERFGDPLLNKLNALAKTVGDSDIIRTVMEAYISHACQKEKAADITIAPGIIRKGGSSTRAPPPEFVYSNEVIYMDGVPPRIPSKGCVCIGPCRENSNCFCLKRQESYFASFVIEGGPGYTGFACREDGTIKDAQYPTWECSDECECPPSCRNRVMQKGRDKKVQLEIFETRQKGWGVKTKSFIKRGTFVGIYAGELIPEEDTDVRGMIYGKVGRTYLFDLDHWHISQPPADLAEIDPEGAALAMDVARQLRKEKDDGSTNGLPDNIDGASLFTVDAFHWGNFTRYLNHSCDPNLQLGSVYYDDFDVRKPRLCITSKRDIPAGQELTISYFGLADDDMVEGTTQVTSSFETKEKPSKLHKPHVGSAHVIKDDGQQRACLCKARNCRGNMFN